MSTHPSVVPSQQGDCHVAARNAEAQGDASLRSPDRSALVAPGEQNDRTEEEESSEQQQAHQQYVGEPAYDHQKVQDLTSPRHQLYESITGDQPSFQEEEETRTDAKNMRLANSVEDSVTSTQDSITGTHQHEQHVPSALHSTTSSDLTTQQHAYESTALANEESVISNPSRLSLSPCPTVISAAPVKTTTTSSTTASPSSAGGVLERGPMAGSPGSLSTAGAGPNLSRATHPSVLRTDLAREGIIRLFCGGLSFESEASTLSEHFSRYGEVVDCRIAREITTNRHRGFGFVAIRAPQYQANATEDSNSAAMDEMKRQIFRDAPHEIQGRRITVQEENRAGEGPKLGSPTLTIGGASSGGGSQSESELQEPRVFVANLDGSWGQETLKDYFSRFGEVVEVHIVTDANGVSRNFAFVTFATNEVARQVCDGPLDWDPSTHKRRRSAKHQIHGREVTVREADPKRGRARPSPSALGLTSHHSFGAPAGHLSGYSPYPHPFGATSPHPQQQQAMHQQQKLGVGSVGSSSLQHLMGTTSSALASQQQHLPHQQQQPLPSSSYAGYQTQQHLQQQQPLNVAWSNYTPASASTASSSSVYQSSLMPSSTVGSVGTGTGGTAGTTDPHHMQQMIAAAAAAYGTTPQAFYQGMMVMPSQLFYGQQQSGTPTPGTPQGSTASANSAWAGYYSTTPTGSSSSYLK